jgi:hypothetical protein
MSFNTANKIAIREHWNLPIIKYISTKDRIKFHYFGLPGIKAYDVVAWKDYIDSVTAFEGPDNIKTGQGSNNLATLEKNLILMGFYPKCYCGILEHVLHTTLDNLGNEFKFEKYYTLFNLDFCNSITTNTKLDEATYISRFESFGELARLLKQKCTLNTSGSVWLVTLREELHKRSYQEWLSSLDDAPLREKLNSYNNLDRPCPQNPKLFYNYQKLKMFVYTLFTKILTSLNYSSYWFPLILYTGNTTVSPMAHFMFISYANAINRTAPKLLQSKSDFFSSHILALSDGVFHDMSIINEHSLLPQFALNNLIQNIISPFTTQL